MNSKQVLELLEQVRRGAVSPDQGLERLKHLPFEDLGFARVDHHRALRQGFPEVIFGPGKTGDQIAAIVRSLLRQKSNILVTRTTEAVYRRIRRITARARFDENARAVTIVFDKTLYGEGTIHVVCAGTSDIPVA